MAHVFEPAASGRAKCRGCAQPIQRGELRFGERLPNPFAEGRFSPGGFVHFDCRKAYFETDDVLDHVLQFSPALSESEREELRNA
jgi:hypothetical protein